MEIKQRRLLTKEGNQLFLSCFLLKDFTLKLPINLFLQELRYLANTNVCYLIKSCPLLPVAFRVSNSREKQV